MNAIQENIAIKAKIITFSLTCGSSDGYSSEIN